MEQGKQLRGTRVREDLREQFPYLSPTAPFPERRHPKNWKETQPGIINIIAMMEPGLKKKEHPPFPAPICPLCMLGVS
jgi:hypothetical protein